jgi:hypothetical protein
MIASAWQPERAVELLAEFEKVRESTLGRNYDPLFKPPMELFRQAVWAYSAKAVALAALGCRAAIENAGFLFLTHRPTGTGGWNVEPPQAKGDPPLFKPDAFEPQTNLSWMIKELGSRKVLGPEMIASARLIKEHGDAIAHYAEITFRPRYRELRRPHTAPWTEQSVEADAREVLEDIEATGQIVLHLAAEHFRAECAGRTK